MTEMERYGNGCKSTLLLSGIDELKVGNEVIDLDHYSPNRETTPRIVNAVSSFKHYSNQTQKLEEIKNSRKNSSSLQPRNEERDLPRVPAEKPEPSVETGLKSFEILNVGRIADNSNEVE